MNLKTVRSDKTYRKMMVASPAEEDTMFLYDDGIMVLRGRKPASASYCEGMPAVAGWCSIT